MIPSPTYHNFPAALRRRVPPPPPRSPSPEPRTPPALPPRNYLQKEEEAGGTGGNAEDRNVDEAKIDFKSLFHQFENNSPREDAYAAQLRKQAMKFSGQRRSSSAVPTSMSVIHTRPPMAITTSYKRQPMVAQEATPPTTTTSTPATSSTPASSVAASVASSHHGSSSDVSSVPDGQPSLSPSSQTKESPPQPNQLERERSSSTSVASSRVSQLPDRTGSSREGSLPAKRDNSLHRDRSASSEVPRREPERSFPSSPSEARERSASDSRALSKLEVTPPSGKHSELPLPSPPKVDNPDGVIDPGELPPPPPELLNDSQGSGDQGEQHEEQ